MQVEKDYTVLLIQLEADSITWLQAAERNTVLSVQFLPVYFNTEVDQTL